MKLFILALFLVAIEGLVQVTNLKCKSIDKPFADFSYCHIRAINRTYKYISLLVKLYKVPIRNVKITIDMRKRASGYKPFLYNVTFDACKFLRSKNNPVVRYFYSFIEKHSNMNHTCPYDHDLILEKLDTLFLNHQFVNLLPMPEGDYGLFTTWYAYGIPRAQVDFYYTVA